MKNDDLSELSTLWQSETPPLSLDIKAAQRRYRWQRWVMRFNVVIELLALVIASGLTIWAFTTEIPVVTLIWLPLLTVWGWVIFFPLNLSRWRSFNLMKSKSLNESIQDHIRLTEQEILRWRISALSTLVLIVLFIGYVIARVIFQPYTLTDHWFTDAGIIGGLVVIAGWFYHRQKASQRMLKTLSE